MPINEHSAGLQFENLIMKAFNCKPEQRDKYGARGGFMQNLYRAERGEKHGLMEGSFEYQFKDIQQHIINALQKLQKSSPSKNELKALEDKVRSCTTAACLSDQVYFALVILSSERE